MIAFRAALEQAMAGTGSDREFLVDFLRAVGVSAEAFPPHLLDVWTGSAPALRYGRPPWQAVIPVDRLADASFPIPVVSGNHHPAYEATADALTRDLRAERVVIEGGGHAVQMVADPFNSTVLQLWRRSADS